jgi:hypothetical protein
VGSQAALQANPSPSRTCSRDTPHHCMLNSCTCCCCCCWCCCRCCCCRLVPSCPTSRPRPHRHLQPTTLHAECLCLPLLLLLLQVLFLPSNSKLPYQQTAAPAAAAANGTARKITQLPQALQTLLASKRRQLVPGFICNLFLVKPESSGQQPKLFGLSEWADGSGGSALKDRHWVPNSRLQVGAVARVYECVLAVCLSETADGSALAMLKDRPPNSRL